MKRILLSCLVIGLLISPLLNARPVSYPGGWTSMIINNAESHSFHVHYSPTIKYSIGYKLEYWRAQNFMIHAVQMNNLLKRWNRPRSQANLYLKSGLGIAHSFEENFESDTELAAFTGLAADWENQRFFVSYENRYTEAGDIDDFFMQSARVGLAPYIGDYGDLHTWIMIQAEHNPENSEKLTITPLLRFFKGVHLLEAGASLRGDILFNWIIRF